GGLDANSVTYSIPAVVRVRGAAQDVGEAAVRHIVEAYLSEALGAGALDAVLRSVELAGPIRIPAGAYAARVLAPPATALAGRVRLQVEFTVGERVAKSVWITADIGRFAPVVVTRRAISRGELIGPDDFQLDRRDLADLPRDVLTDPADAANMVA